MEITRLSTKGQIILLAGRFPQADLDQVAGYLRLKRKAKTLAQMRTAIRSEVTRRHDRGRY